MTIILNALPYFAETDRRISGMMFFGFQRQGGFRWMA